MLIFKRGLYAMDWAWKELVPAPRPIFLQLGSDHPVRDAFDGAEVADGLGALSIVFSGRFARREEVVKTTIGRDGRLFPTARPAALALSPGWYPLIVPQSRTGVNAGAVQILPGYVSVLEYRPNWLGPPGGKFVSREIGWENAVPIEDFPRLRDEGALSPNQ